MVISYYRLYHYNLSSGIALNTTKKIGMHFYRTRTKGFIEENRMIFRRPPLAKKGEVNYHLIDRFTFVHFLIGVGYGLLGLNFLITLFLAIGWEIIEDFLKANLPFIFPHATGDTLKNAVGDGIAVILGWATYCYIVQLYI